MKRHVCFLSAAIPAILCLLLIQGCGGSDPMSGTYALDKEAARAAAEAKVKAESNAARKKALQATVDNMDEISYQITLNDDGTASSSMGTLAERTGMTGTWETSGNTLTLTMTPPEGAAETITATIEGDTIKLTPPADSVLPFEVVLKKRPMN